MGKAYTATGIAINFGGTDVPDDNLEINQDNIVKSGDSLAVYPPNDQQASLSFGVKNAQQGTHRYLEIGFYSTDYLIMRVNAGGTQDYLILNPNSSESMAWYHNGTRIMRIDKSGNMYLAGSIGTGKATPV